MRAIKDRLAAQWSESPWLAKMNQALERLSPRDRQALTLLAWFGIAALLFLAIWQPAQRYQQQAQYQLQARIELLEWMQANEAQARSLTGQQRQSSVNSLQGLNTLINRTARQHQLNLKRFEPEGQNSLRVWLEQVDFNRTLAWLVALDQQHGLRISQIAVDRRQSGIADVKLVIKLPEASS